LDGNLVDVELETVLRQDSDDCGAVIDCLVDDLACGVVVECPAPDSSIEVEAHHASCVERAPQALYVLDASDLI
jgi:hypothetical protein